MEFTLDQVAKVDGGYAWRGKVESEPGGSLTVLQLKDVSDMSAGTELVQGVPGSAVVVHDDKRYDKYRLEPGDLLLQVRGQLHRAALFNSPAPAIAAQGVAVIRTGDSLLPDYLLWLLRHPKTLDAMRRLAKGTQIPFVSKKALARLPVLVPTLDVQRRIAAADQLRTQQRNAYEQLLTLNDQLVDAVTWRAATQNKD
ncbi:restriction endonuclease subunit S [bacterium]|nr:restriction endonuclease subunit S [bacterium]